MPKSLILITVLALTMGLAEAHVLERDMVQTFSDSNSCRVDDFVTAQFTPPDPVGVAVAWEGANIWLQGKPAEGLFKVLSQGTAQLSSYPGIGERRTGQNITCMHWSDSEVVADGREYECAMYVDQNGAIANHTRPEGLGGGSVKN